MLSPISILFSLYLAVPSTDPILQSNGLTNSTTANPHLGQSEGPGIIRPRPVLDQYSVPSMRINHRLQARLQRIRRLAAAEMEKKAAASNDESNFSNISVPVEPSPSEHGTSFKSNHKSAHFKVQAKRAQSDVHLRLKCLELNKTKHTVVPFPYHSSENKNMARYKNRFSNYTINEGIIPTKIAGPIKNSCSMSQCKTGGPLNWKRDSCQIPLYQEDRLRSLQPLPEQDGQTHDLVQHVHNEDMDDVFASTSKNHYNDDLFYYKNRSMSADMQNEISNHNLRSNSCGEAQNTLYHNGQSLLGNDMAKFNHNCLESNEQNIKHFLEYELIEEKMLSQEQPLNTANSQDNETKDNDKNKIQDFSTCQKQILLSERFSRNGNSHTSTDV